MSIVIDMPRPLAWQRQVIDTPARFKVLAVGRRAGKSELLKNQAVTPETLRFPVGWFSPSYKEMLEVWRDLARRLAPIIARSNASERRMEFTTGGVLEFWSLENAEAGRGRKYRRVLVDEAAFVPTLWDSWNYAIRPTLADYTGDAYFASTPKGRNGYWRLYQLGIDPAEPDWAAWQMPSEVNDRVPASELADMRRQLPERVAQQELDAMFIEDAGGVFRRVVEASTGTVEEPRPGAQYVYGIDWAFSSDYTAICIMDALTNRQVYLDRYTGADYTLQRQRIISLAGRYPPAAVIAEANAMGRPNNEELRRAGLPVRDFTTGNASKAEVIETLAGRIERGELVLLNDPAQVGELQAYEGERMRSGGTRYGSPPGMHDDTVMALALAVHGLGNGVGESTWVKPIDPLDDLSYIV